MKKLMAAVATSLILISSASADTKQHLCGVLAETAGVVVELQNLGKTWQEIQTAITTSRTPPRNAVGQKILDFTDGILEEAYYSWNSFSQSQVKQLAFTLCQSGL